MDASSQCEALQPANDQPTSMELLNTSLNIIASFCSGTLMHDQTTLETQSKQVRLLHRQELFGDEGEEVSNQATAELQICSDAPQEGNSSSQ